MNTVEGLVLDLFEKFNHKQYKIKPKIKRQLTNFCSICKLNTHLPFRGIHNMFVVHQSSLFSSQSLTMSLSNQ